MDRKILSSHFDKSNKSANNTNTSQVRFHSQNNQAEVLPSQFTQRTVDGGKEKPKPNSQTEN